MNASGDWRVEPTVESLHCEACKQRLPIDKYPGRKCPECQRAAMIADATDRQTAAINVSLAKSVATAVFQAIEEERRKTMATTKQQNDESGNDLQREIQDGLWRAGAEALIDTARVALVEMLAAELPEDERETAAVMLAKVLRGKLGIAIVAATAGGALYTAEAYGMDVPLLDPETSARVGREFRVLAVHSASMTAFEKFAAPLRDLAAAKFGKLIQGVGSASKAFDRARAIKVG